MATLPRAYEEDDLDIDWSGSKLPGHTVNKLFAAGDVEGAQKELMRLAQEGIDSGEPREMNERWLEEMLERARARAEFNAR